MRRFERRAATAKASRARSPRSYTRSSCRRRRHRHRSDAIHGDARSPPSRALHADPASEGPRPSASVSHGRELIRRGRHEPPPLTGSQRRAPRLSRSAPRRDLQRPRQSQTAGPRQVPVQRARARAVTRTQPRALRPRHGARTTNALARAPLTVSRRRAARRCKAPPLDKG
jgi:hypothetical protein